MKKIIIICFISFYLFSCVSSPKNDFDPVTLYGPEHEDFYKAFDGRFFQTRHIAGDETEATIAKKLLLNSAKKTYNNQFYYFYVFDITRERKEIEFTLEGHDFWYMRYIAFTYEEGQSIISDDLFVAKDVIKRGKRDKLVNFGRGLTIMGNTLTEVSRQVARW